MSSQTIHRVAGSESNRLVRFRRASAMVLVVARAIADRRELYGSEAEGSTTTGARLFCSSSATSSPLGTGHELQLELRGADAPVGTPARRGTTTSSLHEPAPDSVRPRQACRSVGELGEHVEQCVAPWPVVD